MKHKGGNNTERNPENSFRPQIHVFDNPLNRIAPMGEKAQPRDVDKIRTEITIDKHEKCNDRKGGADTSPSTFQNQEKSEGPDDKIALQRKTRPKHQAVKLQKDIYRYRRGENCKEYIEIGNVIGIIPERLPFNDCK